MPGIKRIPGLKQPRLAMPRLGLSTKGKPAKNPFRANTMTIKAASLSEKYQDILTTKEASGTLSLSEFLLLREMEKEASLVTGGGRAARVAAHRAGVAARNAAKTTPPIPAPVRPTPATLQLQTPAPIKVGPGRGRAAAPPPAAAAPPPPAAAAAPPAAAPAAATPAPAAAAAPPPAAPAAAAAGSKSVGQKSLSTLSDGLNQQPARKAFIDADGGTGGKLTPGRLPNQVTKNPVQPVTPPPAGTTPSGAATGGAAAGGTPAGGAAAGGEAAGGAAGGQTTPGAADKLLSALTAAAPIGVAGGLTGYGALRGWGEGQAEVAKSMQQGFNPATRF